MDDVVTVTRAGVVQTWRNMDAVPDVLVDDDRGVLVLHLAQWPDTAELVATVATFLTKGRA